MLADVFRDWQDEWSLCLDKQDNHIEMHWLLYHVLLIGTNKFFIKWHFQKKARHLKHSLYKDPMPHEKLDNYI